jgi:hypothetical protein
LTERGRNDRLKEEGTTNQLEKERKTERRRHDRRESRTGKSGYKGKNDRGKKEQGEIAYYHRQGDNEWKETRLKVST